MLSLRTSCLPALVVMLAGGCKDRLYDFGGTLKPIDASATGTGGTPFVDALPLPDASVDVTGVAGTGGSMDAGGGASGHAGGGAGGAVQLCDPASPDRQTDPFNCGTCLNNCTAANSVPGCAGGACKITCVGDFVDADKNLSNGCECEPSNGGVESCDGLDNNCNGTVDEGFDFQNDIDNCGGCNKRCSFPFATATCKTGVCTQGACLAGFYDRDPNVPGCETACQKTNGGVEICDGLDNDCDGTVDNNVGAATITCKTKGVCSGTMPTCMGQSGWVCNYPTTYQELEDTSKGCDGLDNDCDGLTDEPFEIGKACVVGTGPCAGTGVWVCDNTQATGHHCMGSMKAPGVEVCNGKDDDCDGEVDELDSQANRTTDDKIVYVAAQNVTMFVYEATRYDATATDHGFDSTRRPCSVPGRQPWTNVTKEEAEAACEKIGLPGSGWRLCTAAEWFDVCNGSGNTTFPYGNTYSGTNCNGYDYTQPNPAATIPTGAATMCVSDQSAAAGDEFYDMSGNVKEWVVSGAASTSTAGPYELRGGAYDIASFVDNSVTPAATRAPGLQCDASTPAPSVPVRLPSVGFRCCKTGMLP
ncbi:MAG TPA: MopE-related protein [Polyangia bacterium]|nr:MopE-related protein [Polyangia bacterium]